MRAFFRYIPAPLRRRVKSRILPPFLRLGRSAFARVPKGLVARRYRFADKETFVGYYDVCPASPDGAALLAHVSSICRRSPVATDEAIVGSFDLESGQFTEAGRTTLWCWQMGARLRWWPGEGRGLVFNALHRGIPAFCLSINGGKPEPIADRPLFDVSADGRIGAALNFGRLAWARPGYGYAALADPFEGQPLPQGDGITIVDIHNGRSELVVPLPIIVALDDKVPRSAFHYLNVISLSPSGRSFSVLHKWLTRPDRSDVWEVRAVVGRTDGTGLQVVPLPGAPSHYWWLDDERVAYTTNPRGVNLHSSYFLYDMPNGELSPLHPNAPRVDGHPSLHRDSGRWVTDSYPNLFGEQVIYLLEPDGSRKELGRFRADPYTIGEWRCDLHPRWMPDGRSVVVDSTHEGGRGIYQVPVPAKL